MGSFRSWLRLLFSNRPLDPRYLPRALFVLTTTFLTGPLKLAEKVLFERALQSVELQPSPVFVIGHWRSGTTFLHHLLCQDQQFTYLNLFQALTPGFCLVGERWLQPLLGALMHKLHPTRIIDNVPLEMCAPQEEEFAFANLSPYSFLHIYSFPQRAAHFINRYVLFKDIPPAEKAIWQRNYLQIMRKAVFRDGVNRIVAKNPANAGRLPAVLELFPQAKFIHLLRDPYQVFLSTRHLYHTVIKRSQLQSIKAALIDEYILRFYSLLMKQYLSDRHLIPDGNLVEVRFEDLEARPLPQLQQIYRSLNLSGYEQVKPAFRSYLASVSGYQKNQYRLEPSAIARINNHWGFAFETWGYPMIG
jgi:hypothetical protein